MQNKFRIFLLSGLVSLSASSSLVMASDQQSFADDRYVYIGSELGISTPPVDKFDHKSSGARFTIKRSNMIGGRIGYSFYPDMEAEASFTYQPKYQLSYVLPKKDLPFGQIPETAGKTDVSTQVLTINLIYNFDEIMPTVKPYFIIGAGAAKVSVKESFATTDALESLVGKDFKFFKLHKTSKNHLAWQVGAGLTKEITENFSVDFSAKLQVVQSIKLEYSTFDIAKKQFVKQSPVKQTLGVGEFTFGLLWKLPM
jgi:opacity protein-like surface antigen